MIETLMAFFETTLGFTILIFLVSCIAATFGVLTGLGGGILIVPALSFFQIDLRHAMGVSLISIVALSLITGTKKINQALTHVKMAMFLETAAVIGAVIGALILPFLPVKLVAYFFGFALLFIVVISYRKKDSYTTKIDDNVYAMISNTNIPVGHKAHFIKDLRHYSTQKLSLSWLFMGLSGMISGILGIGSGALKVFAMDHLLSMPYKVSTATSNFMVGITAAASIGIYYFHHYFNYGLMFPVILGVYAGTFLGSELLLVIKTQILRRVFGFLVFLLAIQMFYKGFIL